MCAPISLNEAPGRFLDPNKWAELLTFASNDLLALTYINAPYPEPDYPQEFFWGRNGSFDRAVRCYDFGRELLDQCRDLLIEGRLVAIGTRPNGRRGTIKPIEWANLWPMFATNRATGPKNSFDDVQVIESSNEMLSRECAAWLRQLNADILSQKKQTLFNLAQMDFGSKLTHSIFNAAYKAALGRSRGRPRKNSH
jgi:hypothetical protein